MRRPADTLTLTTSNQALLLDSITLVSINFATPLAASAVCKYCCHRHHYAISDHTSHPLPQTPQLPSMCSIHCHTTTTAHGATTNWVPLVDGNQRLPDLLDIHLSVRVQVIAPVRPERQDGLVPVLTFANGDIVGEAMRQHHRHEDVLRLHDK